MLRTILAATCFGACLAAAGGAQATVMVVETGSGAWPGLPAYSSNFLGMVGADLRSYDTVLGATASGTWGSRFGFNYAAGALSLDGVEIARCDGPGNPCADGVVTPFTHIFTASELENFHFGRAPLNALFTGPGTGDIGPIHLYITIDRGPVPEPAAWALMITGFALLGTVSRLRRAPRPA